MNQLSCLNRLRITKQSTQQHDLQIQLFQPTVKKKQKTAPTKKNLKTTIKIQSLQNNTRKNKKINSTFLNKKTKDKNHQTNPVLSHQIEEPKPTSTKFEVHNRILIENFINSTTARTHLSYVEI